MKINKSEVDEKRLNLKRPEYARGEQLVALRKKIAALAEELRKKKEQTAGGTTAEKKAIFPIIKSLLEQKFLDEENLDVQAPKTIKIRWRVVDEKGERIRLQRPVHNRTSLSAAELLFVIEQYTHKKLGSARIGVITKIERIEKSEGAESTFTALTAGDRVVMPLLFPGPILPEVATMEFRVTFSQVDNHVSFPKALANSKQLPTFVDCGVNLYYKKQFGSDLHNVVLRAFAAGVEQMVLISVDGESSERSVAIAAQYPNSLFPTVGVHPAQATNFPPTPENIAAIRELAQSAGVCALGEIGLDFSVCKGGARYKAPKEADKQATAPTREHQAQWFEAQLNMAVELNLPVLLHERDAHADFVSVVKKFRDKLGDSHCTVNCFSGGEAELKAYTSDLNLNVVITGLVCNDERAKELRAALQSVKPLNKLTIGSDAPFLTPFNMEPPFPKINYPETLPHVATFLAELLNVDDRAAFFGALAENSRNAFKLPVGVRSSAPLEYALGEITLKPNYFPQPVTKAAANAAEGEPFQLPEGVTEKDVFLHANKYYRVTEKEKTILDKQKGALDAAAFEALLNDFALEVVAELPEKKVKKKKKKSAGRGGRRGGRRGRGRGRGRGGRR